MAICTTWGLRDLSISNVKLTARSMDSSLLNMLPENRLKRPLMLITETLGLWKLLWYGIEVDVRLLGMFLVTP